MAESKSLRVPVEYDIYYVDDDGKIGMKHLVIDFISQAIYKDYIEIVSDAREAIELSNKITNTTTEMGYSLAQGSTDKDNHPKEEIVNTLKTLNTEYNNAIARLNELANNTYEKKMRLIRKILKKNQIEDPDLYSTDWWMNNTTMSTMMDFIKVACTKDDEAISVKKKL